ncbi:MAG: CehA/McbA family metallohydrolase [Candidatus Sumerlaeaceae bacterium]
MKTTIAYCIIAGLVAGATFPTLALPPQRLATASSAANLTVRRDTGSTATSSEITETVTLEEESLYGKPITGKLSASRVDAKGLDVPGASAVPGDYLLQNAKVSFVVNAPEHPNGNANTGGYVIDAFMNDRPGDRLGQLHLYLNDKYPRMARYTTAKIVLDGSTTSAVAVEVTGQDIEDPTIDITTTYTLRADETALELHTALVPRSNPLKDFIIGDAFAWGPTQQFVPGSGFDVGKRIDADWVGGIGRGVAYGYYAVTAGHLWGPAGSTWVDANVTTASVAVGQAAHCQRFLAVGHDLAEVSSAAWKARAVSLQKLSGSIIESESQRGATGVRVTISRDGKPLTQAISRDGKFEAYLPAGKYKLDASDAIRSVSNPHLEVDLSTGPATPVKFSVASPAVLNLQVEDPEKEEPIPCRIRLFGINGTKDPDLGPAHETRTRNTVYLPKGMDRIPVPGGDYNLVVTRGIEYDMTTVPLRLERNRETSLKVQLHRAFKVGTMVSADFHLHMKNSFDSAVSLEDRVISCIGEGLEVLVATDHNYVTDLEPVIQKLGLSRWGRSIIGNEITTRKHMFGHFNAFPMVANSNKPGNGASMFEKTVAAKLMEDAAATPGEQVVQINHPRAGDIGYFDRVQMSSDDGLTTHLNWSDRFTAIEIFNGKRIDQFYETELDWFNLLNVGYRFTATGNSDSHKVFDAEPGYPRNYVDIGDSAAASVGAPDSVVASAPYKIEDLVKAVNEKHAVVVTNGPVITFRTKSGKSIGQDETVKTGPVAFQVRIEGANFVQPNEVHLIANGKKVQVITIAEITAPLKWEGELTHDPTQDTWYAVRVRGLKSMEPIMTPFNEGTVELDPTPLAVTNPIWIDRDGDGKFTALNQQHYEQMHRDRSAEALANIDQLTSQSQQRNLFSRRKRAMPGES